MNLFSTYASKSNNNKKAVHLFKYYAVTFTSGLKVQTYSKKIIL